MPDSSESVPRPVARSRIDALDGLRGLAILLVLWLHYWELTWTEGQIHVLGRTFDLNFFATTGTVGVNLFFFISGFCLFWARTSGWKDYLYKRFIKIVPSYVLVIVVICLFFETGLRSPLEYAWHLATHALFIHNWWHDTYGSINGVLWSLGVEVQFYVLFPVLALLLRRHPVAMTLGTVAFSTAYRWFVLRLAPSDFHFWLNQLPGFLDHFIVGMGAALLVGRVDARPELKARLRGWATWGAIAGAGAFIGMLQWAHAVRYEPGIPAWEAHYRWLLLAVIFLLSVCSIFAMPAWRRLLANPPLVFLSTISYNLYLWHQFLARQLVKYKVLSYVGPDPHQDPVWKFRFWALAVSFSLLVSVAITYGFERPLLRWRKKPIPVAVPSTAG